MTTVFVGNIAYDVTQQEVVDLFSSAGKVTNFRFVTDKETGRSRGFGFCEFATEDEAEYAIEIINNSVLHGRTLKVDSADGNQDGTGVGPKGGRQQKDIDKALGELGLIEMYDIVFKFKELISNDYHSARRIVSENPILSQALLKCCKIFNQMNNPQGSTSQDDEIENDGVIASEDVVREILKLSPEQIENLPDSERHKVLAIIQEHMNNLSSSVHHHLPQM